MTVTNDPNLFVNNETPVNTPTEITTPSNSSTTYEDLLRNIKNESGTPKYDSVEKALAALQFSQEHIRRLEEENRAKESDLARLRELEGTRESVEDVVDRLLKAKNNQEPVTKETPSNGTVDKDSVAKLVRDTIQASKAEEMARNNIAEVQNTLAAKFGEKAKEVVALKAKELGVTPEYIGELASQNPKMVLTLFNTSPSRTPITTPTSVHIPLNPDRGLEKPTLTKSVMQGATMKEQLEAFRQVKEYTNKRLGVTDN